jgi:hypothetical protein
MTKTKSKDSKAGRQDMRTEIQTVKFRSAPNSNYDQKMKPGRAVVWVIGIWNLELIWDLVLGAWNFNLMRAEPSL